MASGPNLIHCRIGMAIILLAGSTFLLQAQTAPPQSTFFSTLAEESYSTYQMPGGNGDLWPSCWADDGNLYAANGDGSGFSSSFHSMAVNMITGMPPSLTGTYVAGDVGTNYVANSNYTDKPTGMLCAGNAIYLAFQNLNEQTFNDAPAASIVMSLDHGHTWTLPSQSPMFGTSYVPVANSKGAYADPKSYLFTTIFFLDFGQNSMDDPLQDGYIYAYGLDNDWSDQQAMYLARVPTSSVLDRSTWQFYTGASQAGPNWSSDITQKAPVLLDKSLRYPSVFTTNACPATEPIDPKGTTVFGQPVIGQGGVVYDKPLNRYIFASWSCATHEFYEAPQPWGPWSHIAAVDSGPLQLTQNRGQYGTSIPSKFISADGRSLYLQSNVCCGGDSYTFSLRHIFLQTYVPTSPVNQPSAADLAFMPGTRAISKSTHFGSLCGLNCADQLAGGSPTFSEDDYDDESKTIDWWGYIWPQAYKMNQVVYKTGKIFPDGGWFAGNLTVQARQNFQWIDIQGVSVSPTYPYSNQAGAQTTYTFLFPTVQGDGIRIIGTPGGSHNFTAITSLGVFFAGGSTNLVADPGFELQPSSTISNPWSIEGPDGHGIDLGAGFAHAGANNAWIRDSTSNWNAITQTISVQPNTNYSLTGWVQNNFTTNLGYFGVRNAGG